MHAAETNGRSQHDCFSKEMRSAVEEAFQRQVRDEKGLAAREKFGEMLEALGLTKDEADLLMSECDPSSQRLPYREFLNFIFGHPDDIYSERTKELDGGKIMSLYPTSDGETVDTPAGDKESSQEVAKTLFTDGESVRRKEETDEEQRENARAEIDADSSKASIPSTVLIPSDVRRCHNCGEISSEVFDDPSDNYFYCATCWAAWYGSQPRKLVQVVKGRMWPEDELLKTWRDHRIPGWGYRPYRTKPVTARQGDPTNIGVEYFPVKVRLAPGLVGSHARNCTQRAEREIVGERLCNRYRIEEVVGVGHFTKALLAFDEETGDRVCVKRHNSISIELLTDLLTIGHRLKSVDKDSKLFPRLFDAFYDIDGYTVESLVEGKNCLSIMRERPEHWKDLNHLRILAKQGYEGLVHMAEAGVVHCDLKPDNIMWIDPKEPGGEPRVILVDFGCSRLDCRLEDGRNWALNEGGAGHVGKWAPEMVLRLPITHKADVWGLAVALLELHCGRTTWTGETDTVEFVLAQTLGIVNARKGLPPDLLRRSPLDIQQLYTPYPAYFPVQRYGVLYEGAQFQELRPATWGLGCVLGDEETWDDIRIIFANFIWKAMQLDHESRPSASEMLKHVFIEPNDEVSQKLIYEWKNRDKSPDATPMTTPMKAEKPPKALPATV